MSSLLSSASKIVFVLVATVVSLAFLYEVVVGRTTLDAKDYIALVMMAFTFYFSNKGDGSQPFAGK